MTKNEYIASIMLEAADMLRKDSLDEWVRYRKDYNPVSQHQVDWEEAEERRKRESRYEEKNGPKKPNDDSQHARNGNKNEAVEYYLHKAENARSLDEAAYYYDLASKYTY